MSPELKARFLKADFTSVTFLQDVWEDSRVDVAGPGSQAWARFVDSFEQLTQHGRVQGLPWVGVGGSGKTHLLNRVRRHAQAAGATFLLVDLTDVKDFWATVALHTVQSLQTYGSFRHRQYEIVLSDLMRMVAPVTDVRTSMELLTSGSGKELIQQATHFVGKLQRKLGPEVMLRQNAIRALIYTNSADPDLADAGQSWLQGMDPEDGGLSKLLPAGGAAGVFQQLNWLMAQRGPVILAVDQMDSLVANKQTQAASAQDAEATVEARRAEEILVHVAAGLSDLCNVTQRTLVIASCLEPTYGLLRDRSPRSFMDRFQGPAVVQVDNPGEVLQQIVAARLARAYRDLTPPTPTWPFGPGFFEGLGGSASPRGLLVKCEEARRDAVLSGNVQEIGGAIVAPPPPQHEDLSRIQRLFAERRLQDWGPFPQPDDQEDLAGDLLGEVLALLPKEMQLPDNLSLTVEHEFHQTKKFESLHARVRLIRYPDGHEEHFCLRLMEKSNYNALRARLQAAYTESGIDKDLRYRRLFLLRSHPMPSTAACQAMTEKFAAQGARWVSYSPEDSAAMQALLSLREDPDSEKWLIRERPVSTLGFVRECLSDLFQRVPSKEKSADTAVRLKTGHGQLLLGRAVEAGRTAGPVTMPVEELHRHLVLRAGAGSGKTVFLKRMIEQVGLAGIPVVVIDVANDLVQLSQDWPSDPEGWLEGDAELAREFRRRCAVAIWTPNRAEGRPLTLLPLPDFRQMEEEERHAAVDVAIASLAPLLNPKQDPLAQAVLTTALRWFAQQDDSSLQRLTHVLRELPPAATSDIENAPKLAARMGNLLSAAITNDPLLGGKGEPLDPAAFAARADGRTPISVISFVGLATVESRRRFVNQIAMALFGWAKRTPGNGRGATRMMLVIDEAREFLPGIGSAESKAGLQLIASQGRKYGLGLALATQNPKDLDYRATNSFATQCFGKTSEPYALRQVNEALAAFGGTARDAARLGRGEFYVSAPGVPVTKVRAPMCLTHHPNAEPLTEDAILRLAKSLP